MKGEYIRLEWKDRVATLRVDRPPLNILNSPVVREMVDQIESLRSVKGLRVLVLTGSGDRSFIGGADMMEMKGLDPQTAREFITLLHFAMKGLRTLPFPVIARINGYTLGAGLEMAAACDLRIASEEALFGMPEVRVGIPSVIEAAILPRLIGFGPAMDLLITGRTIDAREAYRIGLIHRLAEPADLDRAVQEVIDDILLCGPEAVRAQKELLYGWMNRTLEDSVQLGIDAFSRAYQGEEPAEGMRAFFEKRPPSWCGDDRRKE